MGIISWHLILYHAEHCLSQAALFCHRAPGCLLLRLARSPPAEASRNAARRNGEADQASQLLGEVTKL